MSQFAIICLILSISFYIVYISYTYIKYKPSCISETYYCLKKKELFTAWMLLVSFLIFPSWVEISPINFQFLPFLSVVSLASVGLAPKYLGEDRKAHIISAALTSTISLIWSIVSGMYIIPLILGILIIILVLLKAHNLLFWIENTAFLNIYFSIILDIPVEWEDMI